MAKKEAPERSAELSKDQQRRLDRLAEEWDKPSSYLPEKLTLADLRLLLEHFPPLRALIRAIAAGPTDGAARATTESARLQAEAAGKVEIEKELHACQQKLAAAQTRSAQLDEALRACQQALAAACEERDLRAKELRACQRELAATRAERDQLHHAARPHPVLDALRADPDLAASLRLDRLPDDPAEALAHAAAVLAQWNQIDLLWERLKVRCNKAQRPATAAEIALLTQALAWHNLAYESPLHEWVEPAPGSPFDYHAHQRASATPSGERIEAVWLPGLRECDRNTLIKKPLVVTA